MEPRVVMASRFKQQCLAILDQVETTKVPVVVTKHGRPVARLVPLEDKRPRETMGSVTLVTDDDHAYFSIDEDWDAEAAPPA